MTGYKNNRADRIWNAILYIGVAVIFVAFGGFLVAVIVSL